MSPELHDVTEAISSLPGIGKKSAQRIAFYLLKLEPHQLNQFTTKIQKFHDNTEFCSQCGAIKSKEQSCSFCDTERESSVICVVEQPSDIFAIENTSDYHGRYHVLMGVLSPLDGIGPDDIRLASLKKRVHENRAVTEVIVATNPSIEGDATANYIASMFADLENEPERSGFSVTRIASGLAAGSQLDFADSQIITKSLRARTLIEP